VDFKLPKCEGAQDEAEIVAWLVGNGDVVTEGQVLVEVSFEKVAVEIEAPATGTINGITLRPGDIVSVGEVLAVIQ
jgi:pyruvate/2-oxoglutarate dehydrogenase complex dihydrolipoamide acyltransferase (E2) component